MTIRRKSRRFVTVTQNDRHQALRDYNITANTNAAELAPSLLGLESRATMDLRLQLPLPFVHQAL